ncbi:MAG: hypothetical protein HY901_06700 [Deltaproteobacteria bacterium]|nr:hypothetical protein [Deltaproteobacteria bacterium]
MDETRYVDWVCRFWSDPAGIPPQSISAWERRHLALPRLLRIHFERFGLMSALNGARWKVYPLEAMRLGDDALWFAQNEQGSQEWGVPLRGLGAADPEVRARSQVLAVSKLSEFLVDFALVNALFGRPKVRAASLEGLDLATLACAWPLHPWRVERAWPVRLSGAVAVLDDGDDLVVSARSEQELVELLAAQGFSEADVRDAID